VKSEQPWDPPSFQIDPSRPLYEQFAEQIKAEIARGSLSPGRRLPSVRDLAAKLRVNPNTVMRTYQELEREKLIVTFRGQGTFVTDSDDVILHSKRAIAKAAYAQLQQVAESIGLTVEQLLVLVKQQEEDEL
jgi:GntR family transcriptional regulator